jgi:RIO-like serine/threonine protein kinase
MKEMEKIAQKMLMGMLPEGTPPPKVTFNHNGHMVVQGKIKHLELISINTSMLILNLN